MTPTPPVVSPKPTLFQRMSNAAKAFAPLIIGAITWAGVVVHSKSASITSDEWLVGAGYLAAALGVYGTTNKPLP